MSKLQYKNLKKWQEYGLSNDYDKRNPSSLKRSEKKEERGWYAKGNIQKWLKYFEFERKRHKFGLPFKNIGEWRKYGLDKDYDKRNPSSLSESENKDERDWYNKGVKKGWFKDFEFNRKHRNPFPDNFKEWKTYGLNKDYDKRNPSSLSESKNKEEKSWYNKGIKKGWLKDFEFTRINPKSELYFSNFEDWKEYGLSNGYDKRNPISLKKSQNKNEKSWYNKGRNEKWYINFKFNKLRKELISTPQFLDFITQDETAKNMVVATIALNGQSYDIEKILMDIYGNKFKDQQQLHELIKENEKKIKDILNEGITNLSYYIGWYNTENRPVIPIIIGDVIDSIPLDKLTPSLEERITRMIKKAYDSSFYKDPINTIKRLKEKVNGLEGKTKQIYENVYNRYQRVLELHEELNN